MQTSVLGPTSITDARINYAKPENCSVGLLGLVARRADVPNPNMDKSSVPILYSLALESSIPLVKSLRCETTCSDSRSTVTLSIEDLEKYPLQALKVIELLHCKEFPTWHLKPTMQSGFGSHFACGLMTTNAINNILKVAISEGVLRHPATIAIGHDPLQVPKQEISLFGSYSDTSLGNVLLRPNLEQSYMHSGGNHAFNPSTPSSALVTGGLGALGHLVSLWLAYQQFYHGLILTGRSLNARKALTLSSFDKMVSFTQLDVAVKEEVDTVLSNPCPKRHTYHASGQISDASLRKQSPHGFRQVFASKVECVPRLSFPQDGQGKVIVFSSISSLLGTGGQANYAAAHGILDAFASIQNLRGADCVSVQWGAWSSLGMASLHPSLLRRLESKGYGSLPTAIGLESLMKIAYSLSPPVVAASPFKWDDLLRIIPEIRGFVETTDLSGKSFIATSVLNPETELGPAQTRQPNKKLNKAYLTSTITAMLTEAVAGIDEIALETPFSVLGVDSIGLVELRNNIATRFHLQSLSSTILFDYPTIETLVSFIYNEVSRAGTQSRAPEQSYGGPDDERIVEERLISILSNYFGVPESAPGTAFLEIGLDSIASVEFRQYIQEDFKVDLPVTAVYDFPTVETLAVEIKRRLHTESQAQGVETGEISRIETLGIGSQPKYVAPIVITGIAETSPSWITDSHCPMSSSDLGYFSSKLAYGIDTHVVLPITKWDVEPLFSAEIGNVGSSYCRFGSVLNHNQIVSFDNDLFRLSFNEASVMDPHARLLLAHTLEVLQEAKSRGAFLTAQDVGTFVGCMWAHEFNDVVITWGASPFHTSVITGNTFPFLAGRIAYSFGWQGPCVPTDTACSSSLVATHMAKMSLEMDQCKAATVGGVNLMLSQNTTIKICSLQALSPVGRCKTFDVAADGYGRGEAVIVTSIEVSSPTLSEIAYLSSTRVNSAGRSNGLTAPSGPAQRALIIGALKDGKIGPSAVTSIAVHGTGTSLGDPIEAGALAQALYTHEKSPRVAYTSIKSYFGHVEGAAGLAGLLLAVGSLKSRNLPPIVGLRNLNPYVQSGMGVSSTLLPRQQVGWHRSNKLDSSPITGKGSNLINH